MTSPLRAYLSARPLPLSLVGARIVAIAAPSDPRESPVTRLSADPPANPLRRVGGRLRRERRTALGTSAAGGHCTSVASAGNLAAFSAARWITIRPRVGGRLRGHVDHDPVAKWIRGTRPLKAEREKGSTPASPKAPDHAHLPRIPPVSRTPNPTRRNARQRPAPSRWATGGKQREHPDGPLSRVVSGPCGTERASWKRGSWSSSGHRSLSSARG